MVARLIGASGFLLLFAGLAMPVLAASSPTFGVPEIDPGSATSALALLAGGMMVVTSRFRRK